MTGGRTGREEEISNSTRLVSRLLLRASLSKERERRTNRTDEKSPTDRSRTDREEIENRSSIRFGTLQGDPVDPRFVKA